MNERKGETDGEAMWVANEPPVTSYARQLVESNRALELARLDLEDKSRQAERLEYQLDECQAALVRVRAQRDLVRQLAEALVSVLRLGESR